MVIGPIEHKTKIRLKKMDDFESFINAKDFGYDSEDVTFTEFVYKLNTHQFKIVKRSGYGSGYVIGTNCMKENIKNFVDKTVVYQLPECVL